MGIACYDPVYGDPLDPVADTGTETGADACTVDTGVASGVESPTHDSDVQPIWDANCTGCHVGGAALGGLTLDAGYDALVGVSSGVNGVVYVSPSDPGQSLLWRKLTGTQSCLGDTGSQMPQGGVLTDGDLQTIYNWISSGAPR
jgi:hypothetical protein